MSRGENRNAIEQGAQALRVLPPQDGDQRRLPALVPLDQRSDRRLRHRLPALVPVRARLARCDGEDPVEQQHALVGPAGEIAVSRRGDADVRGQLAVDVAQRARQRADLTVDGERQADGVARRRIRVLADDQHLDAGEGALERAQDIAARRQVAAAGADLRAQEVPHAADVGRYRRHRRGPAAVHHLVEGDRHGRDVTAPTAPGSRATRARLGPVCRRQRKWSQPPAASHGRPSTVTPAPSRTMPIACQPGGNGASGGKAAASA